MSVNSNANPSYKSLTTTNRISIDLDKTPILTLYMPQASGKWSLKIRNTQNEEVTLRTDASGTGTFEYDLRELTTWKGNQRISFNLWAIGLNSYFVLGDMRFIGINGEEACEEAVSYSTEWLPNELPLKPLIPMEPLSPEPTSSTIRIPSPDKLNLIRQTTIVLLYLQVITQVKIYQ